jgi:hypothetical protein
MDKWIRVKDDDESSAEGCFYLLLIALAIAFILSPGIFLSALLDCMVPITSTGTLWGTSIVASIVIFIICWQLTKNKTGPFTCYAIVATSISILIIIITLINSNNLFWSFIKRMINWGTDQ